MNLYIVTSTNEDGERRRTWVGTQANVRATKTQLKEQGHTDIEDEPVDVPTSKAELLEFLNANCTVLPGEKKAVTQGHRPGLPTTSPTKAKTKAGKRC